MFKKGMKITAGILLGAVLITTVPADVFTASEDHAYMWDMSVGFAAGAHHAITETVVLNDTGSDYLASGVVDGEAPLVSETKPEEETPANPYANMAVANVNEYLSIRAAADTNAEVLGKLYVNGVATVLETLDGWYKITSGNVTGYAKAEYLIVGDVARCEAAMQRVATITSSSRLNIRSEASTSARVLSTISSGKKATVLDESISGWIKIQYNNYTGYISSEYASVATECSYAESREEEAARLAAEEAARVEAERRRQEAAAAAERRKKQAEEARKNYVPPTGGTGQDVANYAVQFVGNPYVLGGSSLTNGIDCSNFVMRIYEAFGVSLPHNSYSLRSVGYEVSASEIQPGDIVCYSGHVAIYIGNGQIVHAANKDDGIKISPKWNYTRVITIRRIF